MTDKNEVNRTGDILETGTYQILSSKEGEICIDRLILTGDNGAKRVWKLRELSPKEAKFDIIKFG